MSAIDALFKSTEYELTWLNNTNSAARVAIDGEDLSQALHILHEFILERSRSIVQKN